MDERYRCNACGNLTRFDVVATRRTRAFHHFTIGGDLEIEDVEVLEERVEDVTCRWCGASGPTIETVARSLGDGSAPRSAFDRPGPQTLTRAPGSAVASLDAEQLHDQPS